MPQVTQVKPAETRERKTVGFIVLGAVVGLAVVGVAGWYFLGGPTAAQTASAVDKLDSQGDYAGAKAKLDAAYGRAWRAGDKALLLGEYAATYYDQGNYSQAESYYEKLNKLQPNNPATLVSLGDTAVQAGDKAEAASAYQAAIPLMKAAKQGPTTAANIQDLEQTVSELQK